MEEGESSKISRELFVLFCFVLFCFFCFAFHFSKLGTEFCFGSTKIGIFH